MSSSFAEARGIGRLKRTWHEPHTGQDGLADVLYSLGRLTGGEEGNKLLREALDTDKAALELQKELPLRCASTQEHIGTVLCEMGMRISDEEGNKLLHEALDAYRAALDLHRELPLRWASTQDLMGTALYELGTRISDEEGNKLLREALAAHKAALQLQRKLPLLLLPCLNSVTDFRRSEDCFVVSPLAMTS